MTQEQKNFLISIIKISNFDPFNDKDYDNRKLKELRDIILENLKSYKELKKRIENKKLKNKEYDELLKAIDLIKIKTK